MLAKTQLAGCLTTLMLKKTIVLAKAGNPWARLLSSPPGKKAPCCLARTKSDGPVGGFSRQP
jgi:hypothetical protein